MRKRPERKAKRKVRRRKVAKQVGSQVIDQVVRLTTKHLANLELRIERIEKFLEPDLSEFHEKEKIAADPLAATVGTS